MPDPIMPSPINPIFMSLSALALFDVAGAQRLSNTSFATCAAVIAAGQPA